MATKYYEIAFVQGDEFEELADRGVNEMAEILNNYTTDNVDDKLRTWQHWRMDDKVYVIDDGIVLTVNYRAGYAILFRVVN